MPQYFFYQKDDREFYLRQIERKKYVLAGIVVIKYKRDKSCPWRGKLIVAEDPNAGRVSKSRRTHEVVKRPAFTNAFLKKERAGCPRIGKSRSSWMPV